MFEDLLGSQSLMGVHVKHLGHKVLEEAQVKYETHGDRSRLEPSLGNMSGSGQLDL